MKENESIFLKTKNFGTMGFYVRHLDVVDGCDNFGNPCLLATHRMRGNAIYLAEPIKNHKDINEKITIKRNLFFKQLKEKSNESK